MPSEFARDTARIYSEMYEEGIEPFRWYPRKRRWQPRSKPMRIALTIALVIFDAALVLAPVVIIVRRSG